jgi:hypothetical protein
VLVEIFGRDQLQHCVAQVLEALVVARRQMRALVGERAVGYGFKQQARVAEVDPNFLLELL